jgi:hypothetical protein
MNPGDKDRGSRSGSFTFTRRTFGKGLTLAGVGAFLGSIFKPAPAAACEERHHRRGRWIHEERKTPVVREVDVLVVGGGSAGVSAAIAAARMGVSTLLVEFFGSLGGNGSNGMVSTFCGITTTGPGSTRVQLVKGVGGDIIDKLAALDPAANTTPRSPSYNPETLKLALDQLSADAGLDILYYTHFAEPILHGRKVIGAIVENKGGRQAIFAKRVVDASGDGDVVARAGAPYELGDGLGHAAANYQASDLVFLVANAGPEYTGASLVTAAIAACTDEELASYKITRKAVISGNIKIPGCFWFNWNNIAVDGDKTDPDYLTNAALAGRDSAAGLMRFLNEKVAGMADAKIVGTASKIGLRESRRVSGDYVFTKEDFLAATKFDDGIGANAWPLEIVTATGRTFQYLGGDDFYTIPYRCLLPLRLDNVIMAGRFISGTHDALASYRVMGPAMVMGHAAGVAAALAVRQNVSFRQLTVSSVQNELIRQGAFLG